MRTETLHLTLAFLGNIDIETAEELIDATPVHRLEPGTLTLDQYGVFNRQRILWAGPSRTPDDLQAIHDGLWLWLSGYGVQAPAQPFRPTSPCCATSTPPRPRNQPRAADLALRPHGPGRLRIAAGRQPLPCRRPIPPAPPPRRLSALAQSAGRNDPGSP